jgi:serine/threonine-protein kinase HipA
MSGAGGRYRGDVVRNYFDNLLPDNAKIRARIQQRFSTASQSAFDLLAEIGHDTRRRRPLGTPLDDL